MMASFCEGTPPNNGKDMDLLEKLKCLQCPFTWGLPDDPESVEEALKMSEHSQYFRSITSCAIRCFEYSKMNNLECALKDVQEWSLEDNLYKLEKYDDVDDQDASGDKEDLGGKKQDSEEKDDLSIVCYHIIFSCECFVLFKLKRFEKIADTLSKIVLFEDMSRANQVRVFEFKRHIFQKYGLVGLKQAIGIVENALELYPEYCGLHILLGKLLGKVRRKENGYAAPSMSEIRAFENALRESYNHSHAVNLAELYREFSRSLKRSAKKFEKETLESIEDYNKNAYDLFCKVYADPERGYRQTVRCAKGFIRLPPPWQDLEKAQHCLKEALEVSAEDLHLNHIAGSYYTITGDLKHAKHYLMLASNGLTTNYGACMDLILIKQEEDSQYSPVSDLELLLKHIHAEPNVQDILCNLGVITYVEMNDFEKAFGYWSQVIEKNINSEKLKDFYCPFLGGSRNKKININKVIISNIQRRKLKGICSEQERAVLSELLTLYLNLGERDATSSQSRYLEWFASFWYRIILRRGEQDGSLGTEDHLPPRGEAGDGSWRREDPGLHRSLAFSSWRCGGGDDSHSFPKHKTSSLNRQEGSWRSNFKSSTVASDDGFERPVRKSSTSSED